MERQACTSLALVAVLTLLAAAPAGGAGPGDLRSRIQALALDDAAGQRLFTEDWASLDAWTCTAGLASVADRTLTIAPHGGWSSALAAFDGLADQTAPYGIEFDWTPDPAMANCFVLREADLSSCCSYMSVEGTSKLYLASGRSQARRQVEAWPASQGPGDGTFDDRPGARRWAAGNPQRVTVVVDPVARTCEWFLMYMGSDSLEHFAYLGQTQFTRPPAAIEFIGWGLGQMTVGPGLRIQKVWGCAIGDSIASGAPGFSPVPGSCGRLAGSQFGYWIEQGLPGERRVLNLGWSGTQAEWTADRIANWVLRTGMKVAFVLVGTNDCSAVQPNDAPLEWSRYDHITTSRRAAFTKMLSDLDAAGVLCVICNIAPRPNYATTGGQSPSPPAPRDPVATKALKDQWRHEHNEWLRGAAAAHNAIYVDIDAALRDPNNPEWLLPVYDADDVHLTVTGYYWLADAILWAVRDASVPGDVNTDGYVDVTDLLYLAEAFSSTAGEVYYSRGCDFDRDGSVDIVDLLILAEHFGR